MNVKKCYLTTSTTSINYILSKEHFQGSMLLFAEDCLQTWTIWSGEKIEPKTFILKLHFNLKVIITKVTACTWIDQISVHCEFRNNNEYLHAKYRL